MTSCSATRFVFVGHVVLISSVTRTMKLPVQVGLGMSERYPEIWLACRLLRQHNLKVNSEVVPHFDRSACDSHRSNTELCLLQDCRPSVESIFQGHPNCDGMRLAMQVQISGHDPVISSGGLNRRRKEVNLWIPVALEDLRPLHRLLNLGSRVQGRFGVENS
jgi:hypothetical protein